MQAAVQRGYDYHWDGRQTYAGNAISKTINLPNDAEVTDVAKALLTAWGAGIKGFTCYRDGSRANQVLTEVKEEEARKPERKYELLKGGAKLVLGDPNYRDVEQLEKLGADKLRYRKVPAPRFEYTDEPLPDNLYDLVHPTRGSVAAGKTYRYKVGDRKVYVTVNRDDSGRPIETFINLSRPADGERVAADIIGRLISLALKHGATHRELFKHLSGHQDQSGAFASTDEDQPQALGYFGCIWEAVAKAMDDDADPVEVPNYVVPGELCASCGSDQLEHTGTCTTCHACGWSKCG